MKTPVLQLIELVCAYRCTGTPHSWQRINTAMQDALKLAVCAGFAFAEEDMREVIEGGFKAHYWIGECSERVYSLAIREGNYSAAVSYEHHMGRAPFHADEVRIAGGSTRQKERLHVGASFPWRGERVTVTSFAKDGGSLTACSYHDNAHGKFGSRVKKRYRITRQDIIDARAEVKERKAIVDRLNEIALADTSGEKRKKIIKALGCRDNAGLAALPLKKIRTVLGQFGG